MNSIFVLIMVFSYNGLSTLQVQFNSFEACEAARLWTYQHADKRVWVVSQGCFSKGVVPKEVTIKGVSK